MPVRLGLPQHVRGLTEALLAPTYATAVGLLLYGLQQQDDGARHEFQNRWYDRIMVPYDRLV